MNFIYHLITHIAWFLLKPAALFSSKLKLFVEGRTQTFDILQEFISKDDSVIWMHAASLGEFEQGLPIIEKLKSEFPNHKILITFFSPSGYEVKKNTPVADVVTYLPIDTKTNAKRFVQLANLKLAIFVKYEIWPNLLTELDARAIPTVLVSAIFKTRQIYFKPYGNLMRKSLERFTHIFVQDENSKTLLESIKITNTTISGDTRLDRVSEILERDNDNELVHYFKQDQICVVAGSTWPEDEHILVQAINSDQRSIKWVIAPHNIKEDQIDKLQKSITKKVIRYSQLASKQMHYYDVVIVDNIGLLTQIYSYADIAYVGGGFATGLHNTLEPAVFGIPVIIGPNFEGFKEAQDLVAKKGILVINNHHEFELLLKRFLDQTSRIDLSNTGAINASYIAQNKGASVQIIHYLRTLL